MLSETSYLEQDLRDFVDILRQQDEYKRDQRSNDSLRMKFQYLKSEVDSIVQDARNVSIYNDKGFSNEFIDHIKQISNEFQQLINYIRSLEK